MDAAGAGLAELKNRQYEASASNAMCRKKLSQVHKNLSAPLENVKDSSAQAVATTKERDAVTAKHEKMRLNVEERISFANKDTAS